MQRLNQWHSTKLGLLTFALIELAIAYEFASLSIDRGNLWYYLLTLLFLIGSLHNLFALIGSLFRGRHKPSQAR